MLFFRTFLSLFLLNVALLSFTVEMVHGTSRDTTTPAGFFGGSDNVGYLTWVEETSTLYERYLYLPTITDPDQGAAVHWNIVSPSETDTSLQMIQLAVAVRATGWVGLGIAESGGMLGSDIALFTAATETLQDSYVLDVYGPPTPDDCNDWTLINSTQTTDGFLIFEATRLLDTGDPQDRAIIDDTTIDIPAHRIIAAWGDQASPAFHGDNRARSLVRFFGEGDATERFLEQMDVEADGFFEVRADNYTVKPIVTEYAYFCVNRADLIAQGVPMDEPLNIVGYLPIFDSGYVHHALAYGGFFPSLDCSSGRPSGVEAVYGYAPGQEPFSPPANVGGPLAASPGGHQSFLIEVHFNNPALTEGMLDNSGVRFYWSRTPREHQLGTAVMGDPATNLAGTTTGNSTGVQYHSFTCPGTCSGAALQSALTPTLTVIQQYLHMHATGARITHKQIRNGEVIHTAAIDYWQFDQQGNALVQDAPYEVLPGDSFQTECWYNTDGNTVFGFNSQDEMCAVFMYYYPRALIGGQIPWFCGYDLGFPACGTDWVTDTVVDLSDNLGRSFGTLNGTRVCPSSIPQGTTSPIPTTLAPSSSGRMTHSSPLTIVVSVLMLTMVAATKT
jgi:hypothetical protein